MFTRRNVVALVIFLLAVLIDRSVLAAGSNSAMVAASGYDVVSYHKKTGPVPGTGWNVSEHEGTTYLFASKKNKKLFDKNPEKYVPAYGGYCAFGVASGKKFYIDPLAWHIENGKLYLNLDKKIHKKWLKDVAGNIKKGDVKWVEIKDMLPKDL